MKPEKFNFDAFVQDLDALRLLVLGESGSGKTFFLKRLISRLQTVKKWSTVVVDPKDEFSYVALNRDIIYQTTFIRRINALKYGPTTFTDISEIAEFAASVAWQFHAILYLEEGVEIVKKMESIVTSHPLVYKVLQQGRAHGTRLIFSTQMFAQTNLAFYRQSTHCIFFWMKPPECHLVEESLGLPKFALNFGTTRVELDAMSAAIAQNESYNVPESGMYSFYLYKAPNFLHYYSPIPKLYKDIKGKEIPQAEIPLPENQESSDGEK